MKYLYTVLERQKQGNTSFYLVKNLKTNEEKVLPISWVRQQYPKGVFSNISISPDGKVSIIKDKNEVDYLSRLTKVVKIVEFIKDSKLDGLPIKVKGEHALKEIEVLKGQYLTPAIFECIRLTDESLKFLKTTKKGKIEVESYEDNTASCEPSSMNKNTSISFYVDKTLLKKFLVNKNICLSVRDINRLEKIIIYSLLYYYQEILTVLSMYNYEELDYEDIPDYYMDLDLKGHLRLFYEDGAPRRGIFIGGIKERDIPIFLRTSSAFPKCIELFDRINDNFISYKELVPEVVYVLYNSRVKKEGSSYQYEIYAHTSSFSEEDYWCQFERYEDDDRDFWDRW